MELCDNVRQLLKYSHDTQRLVQNFSLERGSPSDLINLLKSIEALKEIRRVLLSKGGSVLNAGEKHSLRTVIDRLHLDGPSVLAEEILATIDTGDDIAIQAAVLAQEIVTTKELSEKAETLHPKVKAKGVQSSEALATVEPERIDTWTMRCDASPALRALHEELEQLQDEKSRLIVQLCNYVQSSALTLGWAPGLGHICQVENDKITQESLEELGVTCSVFSTKTTRLFYLPVWTDLGGRLDQVKAQIRQEEKVVLKQLRHGVVLNIAEIRCNAVVMDELDVACSFAKLAVEQNLFRPILNMGTSYRIVGGCHPTVELGLKERSRPFLNNDCFLDSNMERIWLITGPNMAGKSTFLRQNALIAILAQAGSFVPAAYAEIGIIDQIFSRIGAADVIFRDQSTFMVEMLETTAILTQATPRSFMIIDEVGRGTTPEDGIAMSFACLHHFHYHNRCRTLFATNFHALADMTRDFEALGRYCTDIKETTSGSFSFVYRLRKGVNCESHALKVAQLAGLPPKTIEVARRFHGKLKGGAESKKNP